MKTTNNYKGSIKFILSIIIVCIVVVASIIYFFPPLKDKRILSNNFEKIPIYSVNEKCSDTKYLVLDEYFNYNPELMCIFQSKYPILESIEIYDKFFNTNGWDCLSDTIIESRIYGRSYFKENFRASLYFDSSKRITIEFSYKDFVPSGSCREVLINQSEPLLSEDGLKYTPLKYFKFK